MDPPFQLRLLGDHEDEGQSDRPALDVEDAAGRDLVIGSRPQAKDRIGWKCDHASAANQLCSARQPRPSWLQDHASITRSWPPRSR